MKRVIATAGLFAVSVAGLKGQNTTGLSQREATKWWNVSGSLRGFYDDNSLNAPSERAEDSFGIEFSPGFSANLPLESTLLRSSYRLTLNYYEARIENNVDQDHEFKVQANHRFSERRELNFDNTLVYSDAPEVAAQEGTFRGNSTGLRNYAAVDFTHRFTRILGLTLGYRNNYRDYQEDGDGSLSALLDQVENLFNVDFNWYPDPKTTVLVGYQFGMIDHTSDDFMADPDVFSFVPRAELRPERRDSRSHYLYVGGQRKFNPRLNVTARVGGQFTDYYNEGTTDLSPYADVTGNYAYLPNGNASLAVTVQRGSTDAGVDPVNGDVTLDSLLIQTRAAVNHQITSRLTGATTLSYQNYTYNGGSFDGRSDDYVTFDLNLEFKIRENLFANTGYVWYRLLSNRPDISFSRNRIYVGVRAVF